MLCIYMPSTIRGMVALLWIKHNFYQEEQDQLIHGKEKSTVQKSSSDGKTKTKEEPTGDTQIILITLTEYGEDCLFIFWQLGVLGT